MRINSIITIPYGIAQLFKIGQSSTLKVNDNFAHRPDKVLDSVGLPSFKNEMANNRISNTSPISMRTGSSYDILDSLFLSYFRRT